MVLSIETPAYQNADSATINNQSSIEYKDIKAGVSQLLRNTETNCTVRKREKDTINRKREAKDTKHAKEILKLLVEIKLTTPWHNIKRQNVKQYLFAVTEYVRACLKLMTNNTSLVLPDLI